MLLQKHKLIIILIFIISILAAIAIPAYIALKPDIQLNASVNDFITDLRYAQQLSVTKQIDYCAKLFLAEKKYQILECDQSVVSFEKSFPSDIISISATGFSDNEIRFNSYGSVRESGDIVLENIKNNTKTISVKPAGFIKEEN